MKLPEINVSKHNAMVNPKPSFLKTNPKTSIAICLFGAWMAYTVSIYEAPTPMTAAQKTEILKHNAGVCATLDLVYLPDDFSDITKGKCVSMLEYNLALRKVQREIADSMLK